MDNAVAISAAATLVFAGLYVVTRRAARLSSIMYAGLLIELVFVSLFFSPYFQNIVLGKDIAAQVIAFGLFLLWLSHLFRKNGFVLVKTPLTIAVLVYFLAGVLSAILAPRWTWYYSLEEIARTVAVVLTFFMVVQFLNTRSRWNAGLITLMACMGLTSLYGLLQVLGYDFMTWGFRATVSTFGNKDFFASFLTYTMPVALFLAIGRRNAFDVVLYLVLAGLALFNIVYGETRGAWLGLMALAAVTAVFEMRRLRNALIVSAAVALTAALIFQSLPAQKARTFRSIFQTHSGTNIIRVYIWWTSMRMWWDEPLIGQGLGTYQLTYPYFRHDRYHRIGMSHNTRHAHSEELEILSEQGALGFSAWLAFLAVFFFLAVKKLKAIDSVRDRYLFYGLVGGLFAGLIHDSINVNLRWMSSALTFWFLLGLAVRYMIGFDPPPVGKPQRVPQPAGSWRSRVLVAGLLAVFALMFWMEYLVLRTDYLLRIVEGTVEHQNPAIRRMGIDAGRQILRLVPYDHSACYKSAYAYLKENDFDSAKRMYGALFSLAPNYAQMHQNTALLAYQDYTVRKERKHLYQTMLEFEWATNLENHFVNHSKLVQIYTQFLNDSGRPRHHNQYLWWEAQEDSLFCNDRFWSAYYLFSSRTVKERQDQYDAYLKELDDFARQYWRYRAETAGRTDRSRAETRYALKLAAGHLPENPNLGLYAVLTLSAWKEPAEDLVYLSNLLEHVRPDWDSASVLQQVREELARRPVEGQYAAFWAYAMGLVSERLGDGPAARGYYEAARRRGAGFRAIEAGIKKHGV
ncbi:MAG: hypothetical protein A3G34_13040 [Candidatus Lindowbacteria bacterium RIFCSPLOWO2_12_FULL_62_27]|nr:MAG: hypothetical protein A3I06_15010 [Candidatus Lindowbacteria bacterium RIFCSPLOWO2_02_FULL_62_12]OGH62510.1 MAG: hypothetical protein A3G34_13040 [Candidatus Lindowbacteria bacterium RIFCSPLOWO2_12_FULL_62_27]